MELSNLELLVEKKEKGEISEYNLKEILDRNEKGLIYTVIKTFEDIDKIHDIIESEFEEETEEEKNEGDEGSKEMIKEKIERIKLIGEHKGLEEKEDEMMSDNNIDSVNVIEQENDRRKIQEIVCENIDILEIYDINIIEDKSRDALVDN